MEKAERWITPPELCTSCLTVKKSLESDYPVPRGPGFIPDSWLGHRDFKTIFGVEHSVSCVVQKARLFGMH